MLNLIGIISAVLKKITDSFNRANTTSGLGVTDSGQSWLETRGTWKINSNKAQSTDAGSSYPLYSINIGAKNVNVGAEISNGGPGLAFWITDSNSWWASSVNYTSVADRPYSCNCSTGCYSCRNSSCGCETCGTCRDSSCGCQTYGTTCVLNAYCQHPDCGSSTTISCAGNYQSSSDPGTLWTCSGATLGQVCSKAYVLDRWFYSTCQQTTVTNSCRTAACGCEQYNCIQYNLCQSCNCPCAQYASCESCANCGSYSYGCSTCYNNTEYAQIKLYSSVSGTVTVQSTLNVWSGTTGSYTTTAGSLLVSTSGNDITVKAYSDSSLTNQLGSTMTFTATSPTRGNSVGIIKTPSTANAGNTVDSFTAEAK